MYKKLSAALLVSATVCLTSQAQSRNLAATGVVCDSLTRQPDAFVTVRLTRPGQKGAVAVAATNEKGVFTIKAPKAGEYILEVAAPGRKAGTRKLTFGPSASTLRIGTIFTNEWDTTLGTATVTAKRAVVTAEADRIGYSIEDDPDGKTGTMLDMLKKVPMVTVDGDDNIKINGNGSFKVYVDGKPNQMISNNPSLILKNFPASAVKKVEVITSPGAKYDAEGVAGILNIITSATATTTGYTLTPNLSYSNRGTWGSVFGMVKAGKLTLSSNVSLGHFQSPKSQSGREREDYTQDLYHLLRSSGYGRHYGNMVNASVDASYEFDEKNLLSMSGGVHNFRMHNYSISDFDMSNVAEEPVYAYDQLSKTKMRNANYSASVDYQHSFAREGQNLTLSYHMNAGPSKTDSRSLYTELVRIPFELDDRFSGSDFLSSEHTAQADFTTPIGKNHTISTGLKYIYRLNRSNNYDRIRPSGTENDFTENPDGSPDYRHRTDIGAAYGEYTLKAGKTTAIAGLRYEYSRFKVNYPGGQTDGFTADFSDLVPSLTLSYNFSPTVMLKAGYNLRIGRPGINYLSPYVEHISAEQIKYGNPDLESEHAHNYNLSFSYLSQKFNINTSLTYTVQTDGLTEYSFMDNGVMNTTSGNFLHAKTWQLNTFISWNATKTTSLTFNLNGGYSDFKAYHFIGNTTARNSGFTGGGFGQLQQQLPWKMKVSLMGGVWSSTPNLQGKSPSFHFHGLRLERSFLPEDRLTINAGVGNFFSPHHTFRDIRNTETFRYESWSRVRLFNFSIGIRYRLGSLRTTVKKVNRTIENSDAVSSPSGNQGTQGTQGGGGMMPQ